MKSNFEFGGRKEHYSGTKVDEMVIGKTKYVLTKDTNLLCRINGTTCWGMLRNICRVNECPFWPKRKVWEDKEKERIRQNVKDEKTREALRKAEMRKNGV